MSTNALNEQIHYPAALDDVFAPLHGLTFQGYDDLENRFQVMMAILSRRFPMQYNYDDAYEDAFTLGFIQETGDGCYKVDAQAGQRHAASFAR